MHNRFLIGDVNDVLNFDQTPDNRQVEHNCNQSYEDQAIANSRDGFSVKATKSRDAQ